jgi:putative acetyltransferase
MTSATDAAGGLLGPVNRQEDATDAMRIDAVTRAAFRNHPFSRQTGHLIVRGLRDAGALSLSLVATLQGEVVGHPAVSAVTIGGQTGRWRGLGPVSVLPSRQRAGVGSALVRSALRRMRDAGVGGCVVLGDPAYYGRFGFAACAGLICPGVPAAHFMARLLHEAVPVGEVAYPPARSQAAA